VVEDGNYVSARGPATHTCSHGSSPPCSTALLHAGLAGRGGFEPPEGLKIPHPLSRRALSASQPPPQAGASICRVRLATIGNTAPRRVGAWSIFGGGPQPSSL